MVGSRLIVRVTDNLADSAIPHLRAPWRPMSAALAQAVAPELGVPRAASASDIVTVIEDGTEDEKAGNAEPETAWLFHCAGEAYGLILGDLLESLYRVRIEDYSELYLAVKGIPPASPLHFTPEQVRARLWHRWKQMESWFDLGSFQSRLPLDVRRASVMEAFN